MDTVELLMKFADPEAMQMLTRGQMLIAGLMTTVLGMGITFLSLVTLQFIIGLMEKFTEKKVKEPKVMTGTVTLHSREDKAGDPTKDETLIAVISATTAMQMKTSACDIVIKNIERVDVLSSMWTKAAIFEQVTNSIYQIRDYSYENISNRCQ